MILEKDVPFYIFLIHYSDILCSDVDKHKELVCSFLNCFLYHYSIVKRVISRKEILC